MTEYRTKLFNLDPFSVSDRTKKKLAACAAGFSLSILSACGADSKAQETDTSPKIASPAFGCEGTKYIQFGDDSVHRPYIVAEVNNLEGNPIQADKFIVTGIGTNFEKTVDAQKHNRAPIILSPALAEVAVTAVIDGKLDHCKSLRRPGEALPTFAP